MSDEAADLLQGRDPARIDRMLAHLRDLWVQVPQWRLGQVISNVTDLGDKCPDLYLIEDEQLEKRLRAHSAGLKKLPPTRDPRP